VYLASSTSLCDAGAEPAEAGSYAAGLGALGGCNSPGGTCGSKAGTCGSNVACSPAQRAPLMHAGRPTRLGSPVTQRQQPVEAVAAATAAQFASCSGEQLTASSTGKGPVRDVYGQPRVVLPALPATYSKVRSCATLKVRGISAFQATLCACISSSMQTGIGDGAFQMCVLESVMHAHPVCAGACSRFTEYGVSVQGGCYHPRHQDQQRQSCESKRQEQQADCAASSPPALWQYPCGRCGPPHGQAAKWLIGCGAVYHHAA
jgi:hypothetical protein